MPILIHHKLSDRKQSRGSLGWLKRFKVNICTQFAVAVALALTAALFSPGSQAQSTTLSRHHEGGGFKNPYLDEQFSRSRFFTYARMRFFGDQPFAEYEGQSDKVPQVETNLSAIYQPNKEMLQVTWIGHSTTLIQYRGITILTDPIFSSRASPFSFAGPERYTPPALNLDDLPTVDYVIISHNHYDHLDQPTVRALGNDASWLVPLKLKPWFHNEGIQNVTELDWWQVKTFARLKFTAAPTQHFSGRGLWDYAQTLWCSWIIEIDGKKIWFGGDTGYNDIQFKRIGNEHGPFDLALIPIGAFEPRWFMKPMHVNPGEAVLVHKDIKAIQSFGIHWGTFRLSAEPIDAPMFQLNKAAVAANANFTTLAIGETRILE